jgi:transposase
MTQHTQYVIGLDLGDRTSIFCTLDGPSGEILERGSVATTQAALRKRFGSLPASRIAFEVGTHSPWVSRELTMCGHEAITANARELSFIHKNPRKSDRADAEALARVARLDPGLLKPIQHRGPQAQADLALVRARGELVEARTKLINNARGLTKAQGARLPACSAPSFARKVRDAVPELLRPALLPLLHAIQELTDQIRVMDKCVETLAKERYSQTRVLTQVAGVGDLTALAYVLVIEDPERFEHSRDVGPYLGLVPGRDQSGDSDEPQRITRAGDATLRRLLVQASHYILGPFGPDTDLRRWGERLAERGGPNAKKRAVVAVARKLAVLLHRLWTTGEVYEPLHHDLESSEEPQELAA